MTFSRLKCGLGARDRRAIFFLSAFIATALFAVTAWAVGGRGEASVPAETRTPASAESQTSASVAATPEAATQTDAQPEAVHKPTVRVWVHSDGVRPRVLHASPGPAVLRVENETRSTVALRLDRVPPGQVGREGRREMAARVALEAQRKRGRRYLVLLPGEYVFYDEARPQLTGTLIVEQLNR